MCASTCRRRTPSKWTERSDFAHPRYEIIGTGDVYDGRDEVERYYRESRVAFPDQRNELISLRHAGDAVIVEFWLLGTHRAG
ncbi:MAG: nuclear transport factor 2 family protein [Chloroflexi bacterium]|nr:MAG: nuclear transport factor 2 family protein [Chloroflexota bacterium]